MVAPAAPSPPSPYTAYSVSWNLTQRCNLECAHCYMSAHAGAANVNVARPAAAPLLNFLPIGDDPSR